MKMHLTIDELDFGSPDELLEFAAKLKTVMALPFDLLKNMAAAGVASAAKSPAAPTTMRAATEVQNARAAGETIQDSRPAAPKPAFVPSTSIADASAPVADVPPVATGANNPAASSPQLFGTGQTSEIAGDVAAVPTTSVPSIPAAPTDAKPRTRRGRPSNAEKAAAGPLEPGAGRDASGAEAASPSVNLPAAAPTLTPAAISNAVTAGKNEALALEEFQTRVTEILSDPKAGGAFMSTLTGFKDAEGKVCRGVRAVLPEQRAEFLERFMANVQAAAA